MADYVPKVSSSEPIGSHGVGDLLVTLLQTGVVAAMVSAHGDIIRLHVTIYVVHQARLVIKINRQASVQRRIFVFILLLFDILRHLLVHKIHI